MVRHTLLILAGFVLLSQAGCKQASSEPSPVADISVKAPEVKPAPAAARKVARIVFLDQENCCDCTRRRTEVSWAEMEAALDGATSVPVERIHQDTQEAEAKPYLDKKGLMVVPGIYFLDERGELIELLQGEVTKEQIGQVLHQPVSAPLSGHDPAHPSIDCPLAKAGVDPSHLRPFEDVEKYIAFLERADRAAWQKPDEVVAALGLKGTETVVDLGAGSGYFSFRLAKALPNGKVVAADTEPEMIRHLHHKIVGDGIPNLEAALIKPDDPGIPKGTDLVFVCDVLHHVADRSAWLGKLVSEMKPGARLVLIEFKEGKLPEGPPEGMKIPRGELVKLITGVGFVLASEKPDLLPYQTFLVFKKL